MEVERNHLDAEIIDVPVTSVVEVNRETCPVNNLDFDEDNAETETVKEMLVESNVKHGIVECKRWKGVIVKETSSFWWILVTLIKCWVNGSRNGRVGVVLKNKTTKWMLRIRGNARCWSE